MTIGCLKLKFIYYLKIFILCVVLQSNSLANILNIPSQKYPTIQVGIDSVLAGDTVLVQPGEYFENLNIEKGDITLGSLYLTTGDTLYKYTTIINGNTAGSVVTINTDQDEFVFSGFTLTNGMSSDGGGLLIIECSPIVNHLNIIENQASYGGGSHIKSNYSGGDVSISPQLENIIVRNNFSSYDGGGIYCDMMTIPLMKHVKIMNNRATRNGAGICCNYSGRPQLLKCEIVGNVANNRGGGVYFTESFTSEQATIDSSKINRNSASSGGGIFCDYFAGPTIINSEINDNTGNGIYCWEYTRLKIYSSNILRNNGHGATCSGDGSGFNFYDVMIAQNTGSGISLGYYGRTYLSGVTIKKNKDTGIYFGVNSSASFDPENLCNIYHNNPDGSRGRDLRAYSADGVGASHVTVIVDTFSVLIPTEKEGYPLSNFSFNILNEAGPILIDYEYHYYVDPAGNDSNSGLSPEQPLKTIGHQIAKISENNDQYMMIHLAEGRYSPLTNGESFPVYSRPKVMVKGASKESVIINAEGHDRVFHVYSDKFSLQNMTITGGYTDEAGGGLRMGEYGGHLENLSITQNTAGLGGGIYANGHITLKKVDIFENSASKGGGIFFEQRGTAKFDSVGRCNIFNNKGGDQGIDLYSWGERDPDRIIRVFVESFTDVKPGSKHVYPLHHFEMNIGTKVDEGEISQYLFPNFPNPFSQYTNIKIRVTAIKWVDVKIYNIQGQHVKTLIDNELLSPGEYTLVWNGDSDLNQQVASGIYFCRFTIGGQSENSKIVYLK
jgi:predicted outer membrane repeat protein/parallel beta-helix repeat protein